MKLRLKNIGYFLYYSISAVFLKHHKIDQKIELNQKGKLIVSLTTKPGRIHKIWMVIESILRQDIKPDGLFLYLAKEEFDSEKALPSKLLSLRKRGLQIVFVEENLKPHNKYFYSMSSFPNADILTVDDDKIYPSGLIGTLVSCRKEYTHEICSISARKIGIAGNMPNKYINWEIMKTDVGPSHSLLSLGVCGVLYPPGALHQDLFDVRELKRNALLSDDLWIKIMALRNDTRIVSLAHQFKQHFVSITGLKSAQLMKQNVENGQNDVVFNNLLNLYKIDIKRFHD